MRPPASTSAWWLASAPPLPGLASPPRSAASSGSLRTYLFARISERAAADLRRDLFRHLHSPAHALLRPRARRAASCPSLQSDVEALQVLYSYILVRRRHQPAHRRGRARASCSTTNRDASADRAPRPDPLRRGAGALRAAAPHSRPYRAGRQRRPRAGGAAGERLRDAGGEGLRARPRASWRGYMPKVSRRSCSPASPVGARRRELVGRERRRLGRDDGDDVCSASLRCAIHGSDAAG